MPTWGKTILTGIGLFIAGLAVAGDGGRPRLLQDIGVIIALFGVGTIIRGVVRRFRKGSDPNRLHP